jgi:hypothetical protein
MPAGRAGAIANGDSPRGARAKRWRNGGDGAEDKRALLKMNPNDKGPHRSATRVLREVNRNRIPYPFWLFLEVNVIGRSTPNDFLAHSTHRFQNTNEIAATTSPIGTPLPFFTE